MTAEGPDLLRDIIQESNHDSSEYDLLVANRYAVIFLPGANGTLLNGNPTVKVTKSLKSSCKAFHSL